MPLVKSYPKAHTYLYGERREFSLAVNNLFESIALVAHSELAAPNWSPYRGCAPSKINRAFASGEAINVAGIELVTPTFRPRLTIYRQKESNLEFVYGSLATLHLRRANYFELSPAQRLQKLGNIMTDIAVQRDGEVFVSTGHGESMADPKRHPQEFAAQLALYQALGIERFMTEVPPYDGRQTMNDEEIGRLSNFLTNEVASRIKPGVVDQTVSISFVNGN